jgi:hypothetical protein
MCKYIYCKIIIDSIVKKTEKMDVDNMYKSFLYFSVYKIIKKGKISKKRNILCWYKPSKKAEKESKINAI